MSEKKRGSDSVYFTSLLKIWDLESDGIDRKTLLEAGGLSLPAASCYRTEPLPVASRYWTDKTSGMLQFNTQQPVASRYKTYRATGTLQSNTPQPVASKYRTDKTSGTLQSNTPRPVASKYRTDETTGTQLCSELTAKEHKTETVSLKLAENAAGDVKVCTDVLNSTFESLNDCRLFGTSSDNDSIHTPRSSGLSQCCPSCNSHNSHGANWCVECGTVLTKSRQAWSSEDRNQADSIHACTGVTHNSVRRQTESRSGVADSTSRWTLALSPDRSLSESRSVCNTSGVSNSTIGVTLTLSHDRRNHSRLTHACNMIHSSPELRQSCTHSTTIDSHNAAMSVPKMSEIHHDDRKAAHPSMRSCNSVESLYSGLSELLLHDGDNLRCSCSTVPTDSGGRESSAAISTCRLQQHGQRNSHRNALNHCDNDEHYRMLPNMDQQQQNVTDSPLQEFQVSDKHLTTEKGSHAVMHHPKHALVLNEMPSFLLTGKDLGCKLSPAPSSSEVVSGSDRTHVSSKDENMQRSCDNHYIRHWDTSSVYMWRKPSTLGSRKPSTLASRKSRTLEVSVSQQLAENERQQLAAESATDTLPNKGTASYNCPPNHDALCKQTVNASYTGTPGKSDAYMPPLDVDKMEEDQSTPKPLVTGSSSIFLLVLPDELLLAVLSFLSQTDLIQCMLVCWRMHSVASDPSLWRQITLWKQYKLTDNTLLSVVRKYPQKIAFHHCKGTISTRILQAAFQGLSTHLKVLLIDTCDFGSHTGDMLLTSAALHCPKLCSIEVKWTQLSERAFIYCIQHCSRLEVVCLEQTPNITLQSMKHLLECHGKWLKVLMLKGLAATLGMAVVTMCTKQKVATLTSFTATFTQVEQHTIQHLTAAFPNLRRLEIHCTSISEEASFLLSQLPLESLVLVPLVPLTVTSLAHIGNMHTLKSVKYPV